VPVTQQVLDDHCARCRVAKYLLPHVILALYVELCLCLVQCGQIDDLWFIVGYFGLFSYLLGYRFQGFLHRQLPLTCKRIQALMIDDDKLRSSSRGNNIVLGPPHQQGFIVLLNSFQ
jgi:hypothetical protein